MDISDAAKRLFALVDARYLEQKEFAAQLGITPSIVSEWRRGKSESFAKPKYIKAIAELLGTTTEYILTGSENQPAPLTGDELVDAVRGLNAENRAKAKEYIAMLRELQDRQ